MVFAIQFFVLYRGYDVTGITITIIKRQMFSAVGSSDVFCNLLGAEGKVNLIVGEHTCTLCTVRRRKYGRATRSLTNFDSISIQLGK